MGANAASCFRSVMVAGHTVESSVLHVRESETGGVRLRRGVSVPTAWVAFRAAGLMRDGLRIGPWLRQSPVAWEPRHDGGIRIEIPPNPAQDVGPAKVANASVAQSTQRTLVALERRIAALERAVDVLRRDIQGTDLPVSEEDLEKAVDTLRRAGFPVWQVGERWNVGNAILAPAAMVAMAQRIAARSGSRGGSS
jgi:hypothetical protein